MNPNEKPMLKLILSNPEPETDDAALGMAIIGIILSSLTVGLFIGGFVAYHLK